MVTDAGETSMRFRKARLTFIDFTAAVIVVSILTGAAGPRLVPLEEPSREDALHALAGSMRSASALVHAMWQADGGRGNSVDLDGTSIEVDARGFPTRVSIRDALGRDPADARSGFVEVAPRSGVFAPIGAAGAGECNVAYRSATATRAPEIVVTAGRCG